VKMARHVLQISNATMRARLKAWCDRVPDGWRVEFKEPKRSDQQNDRMWAMLGDIAKQGTINGKKYDPDQWKCIFMKQMGKEVSFLPTLDGEGFFPTGFRSSDLSVREMCDMQTFMEVWGAESGISFSASSGQSEQ
jgi:hypothetical protein